MAGERVPVSRRGQALVELALLLPVLMLLAMGTLDVGRVFGGYLALANAAREGAAYASLHANDTTLTSDVTSTVTTELNGVLPGSPTVTVSIPSGWSTGSQATVTVSASFPLMTTAVLGWKSVTIRSQASMMILCSSTEPNECTP